MSGKAVFGGVAMMTLGLAGGWFFRGWRWEDVKVVKERVDVPVEVIREVSKEVKVPEPRRKGEMELYFEEWAGAEVLKGAAVGFCVLDEKGEVVYGSPLAETALCPASALKTLTAGAALEMLGPEFRFVTVLAAEGGVKNGVVAGDLMLVGDGDPTLEVEDLEKMAEDAVKRGLKRVRGTLKVEASVFPEAAVSDHWVWGDLGNAYGVGAFGVNVGHNAMALFFDGGAKVGDAAKFMGSGPDLKGLVKFDCEVKTGAEGSGDGVMVYSSPGAEVVRVRGTVPAGAKNFAVGAAVPDPPKLAEVMLRKALERRGVMFEGAAAAGDFHAMPVLRHESASLVEIVRHMQEVSDNLEAQCLFLMMGSKAGKDPVEVLRGHWEERGVDFKGLRVIDGSGLARATMIRPVDLARVNLLAAQGPQGRLFYETLPGNADGSMRSKRGAMSGVRTEAGFVTRGGKRYTFALMANGLGGGVDFWRLRTGLLEKIGE